MFGKRWRRLEAALTDLTALLDKLERRTDKIETILMVREPGSVAAADAYEGLRKQVVAAATERLAHLAQLVQLDVALAGEADGEVLAKLTGAWIEQASLVRVTDPDHPEADLLFELLEDLGGAVEILEPAYADGVSGRVIRRGRSRRRPVIPPAQAGPGAAASVARGARPAGTERADTEPADTEPADTEPADVEPADIDRADAATEVSP